LYLFLGNEKYSYFIDSMWKDISAAQAACDSIDNTETVKFLDILENSEGILVSGMGKYSKEMPQQLLSNLYQEFNKFSFMWGLPVHTHPMFKYDDS